VDLHVHTSSVHVPVRAVLVYGDVQQTYMSLFYYEACTLIRNTDCVRAARPSGRARCGAGAGSSAIQYQSLSGNEGRGVRGVTKLCVKKTGGGGEGMASPWGVYRVT